MIQFDADPQQTVLGNLQTGLQVVATINMEDLIDGIALKGEDKISTVLGSQLIHLLKTKGSLIDSIDPQKHIEIINKHVLGEE